MTRLKDRQCLFQAEHAGYAQADLHLVIAAFFALPVILLESGPFSLRPDDAEIFG